MKDSLNKRWLWVCLFWAAAMVGVVWNHHKVEGILGARAHNENLRKELLFQQQYARRLEQILKAHDQLYMPVESVQLGVLSIKNALIELAGVLALNDLRVSVSADRGDERNVPLKVSFRGAFENTLLFLSAINAYAYLEEKELGLTLIRPSGETKCDLGLYLRCKVQALDEQAQPPLHQVKLAL